MKKSKMDFYVSIIVILILPLMPIFLEVVLKNNCLDTTIIITAALYSVTVFTSSKNFAYVIGSILPALLFSALYARLLFQTDAIKFGIVDASSEIAGQGHIISEFDKPHHWSIFVGGIIAIIFVAVVHGNERYKRHVLDGEVFAQFY